MQPYFRDAVAGDLAAIGAIVRSPTGDAPSPAALREILTEVDRTDGTYVLVAEFDGQIVAVLHLITFRELRERGGRVARILLLAVAEEYRTSGVGGMLIDHAVARAVDLTCDRVEAASPTSDADRAHGWERAGFVHLERGFVRPLR